MPTAAATSTSLPVFDPADRRYPTPTKLARLAEITITSVAARVGSSRVACAAGRSGPLRATVAQVHNRKTAAAAIHPTATPYCQPADIATAAAAATPTVSATPPRTAISPSRLNAPGATMRVKHWPTQPR